MKRYYFKNASINISGVDVNITSGGRIYLVEGRTFRRADSITTPHGVVISLPTGKQARIFKVIKTGEIKAECDGVIYHVKGQEAKITPDQEQPESKE